MGLFCRHKKSYLPYRMNRLEYQMASFDSALADLAAKVDAVISVISGNAEALAAARAAVDEANARADRVVSEDAEQDAQDDAARAESIAAVSARLDSVLNPPAE